MIVFIVQMLMTSSLLNNLILSTTSVLAENTHIFDEGLLNVFYFGGQIRKSHQDMFFHFISAVA